MQTINILCATDKNFVPYCGIMLTSLFENNKDEHIVVYLLVDDTVKEPEKSKYLLLAEQYKQSIQIIQVDASTFEKYPVYNKQWTNSIYYRLLAAELLPDSVDKIIYLDADIIVTRSIREMWEIDIKKYALGVVQDIWAPNQQVYDRLGLENDKNYFNSGSMLLNLKYWREHDLSIKYMTYIKDNFEKLWFNDQDTLNGVLFDQKLMLPVTYNFQVLFLKKSLFDEMADEQKKELEKAYSECPKISIDYGVMEKTDIAWLYSGLCTRTLVFGERAVWRTYLGEARRFVRENRGAWCAWVDEGLLLNSGSTRCGC